MSYTLIVRRYAPFRSFGGGFEGDDRLFSTSLTATARTAGVIELDPDKGVQQTSGFSSGSAWVGPWAVRQSHRLGAIGRHVGQVRVTISDVKNQDGKIAFKLFTSGNLPAKDVALRPGLARAIDKANAFVRPGSPNPQGTPNIDTYMDVEVAVTGGALNVSGALRGDAFPNAEVFMLDKSGSAAALCDYRTKSGAAGPLRLLIGHPTRVFAQFSVTIPTASGAFGPGTKSTVAPTLET